MRRAVTIWRFSDSAGPGLQQPARACQQQIDVSASGASFGDWPSGGHYLVAHSTYATIEQLQQDGLLTGGADRRGYIFDVAVNGSQGFIATATPSEADKQGWPTLAVDQTMQITER
jgi:hypothetical protein